MKILAAVLLSAAGLLAQQAPVIETVAGFDPEGVRADSIGLMAPAGLASDAAGNVYFSQTARNRVYRVTPDGLLQVAAGNGLRGTDGDDGQARDARLDDPAAVAVDEAGNLYIATATAIRAVAAESGVIRTVVKLEEDGPLKSIAWIAAAPGGRLIVADREARMLKAVDTATGAVSHVAGSGKDAIRGDFGPAEVASLQMPALVAADAAGNVYYAEQLEPRVRRIDANTGEITTMPLMVPDEDIPGDYEVASGLAADAAGNLYVAQVYRDRVLRITPDGEVSVAAAAVALPQSVVVNAAGELLIAELAPSRIVRTVAEGEPVVVAGNGLTSYNGDGLPALETQLAEPAGLTVTANGDLLVASTLADRVLKVEPAGTVTTMMGGGDWLSADEDPSPLKVRLLRPQALLVDANGDLLVSDYDNKLVRRATSDGTVADILAEVPVASTSYAVAMRQAGALASDGTRLLLSSPSDHHVWVITPEKIKPFAGTGEAGFEGDGGMAQDAHLRNPSGIVLDAEGNLYIADTGNHRIRRVEAATGEIKTVWPAGDVDEASLPVGLALDSSGALYAADAGLNRVWKIDVATGNAEVAAGTGEAGFSGDGGPAPEARLNRPCAIAFDKDGKLYIADTGNQRVRRVSVPASEPAAQQ